jgi:tRNA 2-thiouridine synthesizing protein A
MPTFAAPHHPAVIRVEFSASSSLRAMTMEFHKELDARGLNCPLPILKAKKALAEMVSGEILRVVATDAGSVRDFQAFARQTGNELIGHSESNQEFTFFMKRK